VAGETRKKYVAGHVTEPGTDLMIQGEFKLDLLFQLETSASALLAAVFDQSAEFRRWFFEQLSRNDLAELSWTTRVEQDSIDIRMDAQDGSWSVLVENKVRRSSKQAGQLKKYYVRERDRLDGENPTRRLLLVYLAPGDVGKSEVSEVKALEKAERIKSGHDRAVHLSWRNVLDFVAEDPGYLVSDPKAQWFLANAFECVQRTIYDAVKAVYPNEDAGRALIHEIVTSVRSKLEDSGQGIGFMAPWPYINRMGFSTKKTNLTLWFFLHFKAAAKPPYEPLDLIDPAGRIKLDLRAQLHISGRGWKNKALRDRWAAKLADGKLTVPGFGENPVFSLQPDGWVHCDPMNLHMERSALEAKLVELGRAALEAVREFEG